MCEVFIPQCNHSFGWNDLIKIKKKLSIYFLPNSNQTIGTLLLFVLPPVYVTEKIFLLISCRFSILHPHLDFMEFVLSGEQIQVRKFRFKYLLPWCFLADELLSRFKVTADLCCNFSRISFASRFAFFFKKER